MMWSFIRETGRGDFAYRVETFLPVIKPKQPKRHTHTVNTPDRYIGCNLFTVYTQSSGEIAVVMYADRVN